LEAHSFFSDKAYVQSYLDLITCVASLQSWLEYYVRTNRFDAAVSAFFAEAVNDAILAYSFARVGTWRPALQSLRSTLENSLYFLYYKDHPVELLLWSKQNHRMGFTELSHYLKSHPLLSGYNHQTEIGIGTLDRCYADLSKAVHGSVDHFRMVVKTPFEELPSIHALNAIELARFRKTLRRLVEALNQLFVAMFREALQGAALPSLRNSVAACLSAKKRTTMKQSFNVMLHKPSP
jgi:hypothetical protein